MYSQLWDKRVLTLFKDVPLRARRGLSLYKVYGNSDLLVFNRTQSLRSDGVPLSGESPARQDFPRQSHRVDARRDFSRWPHRPCWVRGRNSDLGLVIDIAQLLLSNVRMREMCWHGDLTQSRCHSKNHSTVIVPGRRGHSMIVWTVGRKKDKTSPNCPRQTGPCLNAGYGTVLHPSGSQRMWALLRSGLR